MTRIQSLLFPLTAAVLGAALALPVSGRADEKSAGKPNILFILADDHRADCLGALGHPVVKTPNLDRLVERGTFFSRTYVFGSTVGAVCLPSRAMIATGRTLFHLPEKPAQPLARFQKAHAAEVATLMPRVLAAAGYETFHVGKGGNECTFSLQAFDTNILYDDPTPELRTGSSQRHADTTIGWLRGRKADKPFFIYFAPPVPHDPRVCPQSFRDQYDPAKVPLPESFLPLHPFDNGDLLVRDERLAPWPRTPEDTRRQLADYYACITNLDYHVGRIFATLRQLGQWDNTLIVFAGDNGLSLGEHGLFGKQNLYEFGGMHVPLVVAGPGVAHGRSDALVYLLDLLPTFCDLSGAAIPSTAEGRSLAPILHGQPVKLRDYLLTAYHGPQGDQRAIRDDRWKLIRYPQVDKTQLFDLQGDPHELHDLAADPRHVATAQEMLAHLATMQKQYDDPAPLSVAVPRSPNWTPPIPGEEGSGDKSNYRSTTQKNGKT